MKHRKLKSRYIVRYFRKDSGEQLWRWKSGKMERMAHFEDGWLPSVLFPHKSYASEGQGWREITEKQAKLDFPCYFPKTRVRKVVSKKPITNYYTLEPIMWNPVDGITHNESA